MEAAIEINAESVRRHYDQMAWVYRLFWGDHIHHGLFADGAMTASAAQLRLLDFCSQILELKPGGGTALDVGCGHGGTCLYLASRFGYQVTGFTLSPKQAHFARRKITNAGAQSVVEIRVADAERTDCGIETCDLVWVMESSEHFSDKAGFFTRVGRCLRPGGRLLVAAWTGSMCSLRVRAVAKNFVCPSLLTSQDYNSLITEAGLVPTRSVDLSAGVARTWDVCRRRAQAFRFLLPFLPSEVNHFSCAIPVIQEAYASGELTYSIIAAQRREP
ncbi:MAG TPA: class I SAM-dependent methyltransferase [Clostridia bacterium]|nr:class I SAM-dependent methyltransferase [Clostridia bacterium]